MKRVDLYAVQPSAQLDDLLKIGWYSTDSELSPTQQLYTARGSQGFGTNKAVIEDLFVDTKDFQETVLFETSRDEKYIRPKDAQKPQAYGFYKRPLYSFKWAPNFTSKEVSNQKYQETAALGIFSIPTYCYLIDIDIDQIDYGTLYIKY